MPIQRYLEDRRYSDGIELDFPVDDPVAPIRPPAQRINVDGQITIPQFTADQNDLTLGEGDSFRMSTDGVARTINGLANVSPGRRIEIHNVAGGANISLANQNAGSVATNRIITGTGGTVAIQPDRSAILRYDGTTTRWRLIAMT